VKSIATTELRTSDKAHVPRTASCLRMLVTIPMADMPAPIKEARPPPRKSGPDFTNWPIIGINGSRAGNPATKCEPDETRLAGGPYSNVGRFTSSFPSRRSAFQLTIARTAQNLSLPDLALCASFSALLDLHERDKIGGACQCGGISSDTSTDHPTPLTGPDGCSATSRRCGQGTRPARP
jgi:hypothetical protein